MGDRRAVTVISKQDIFSISASESVAVFLSCSGVKHCSNLSLTQSYSRLDWATKTVSRDFCRDHHGFAETL